MNDIHAVTDTSEYKQPFYSVQISYVGIGAEFRLNDIPFYLENFSGQVDTEIPVSDKIILGKNELSIIVFTLIEESDDGKPDESWHPDARVEATLYVREKNASKDTRKLLSHVKLYPAHKPESAAAESLVINEQELPTLDYDSNPWQPKNRKYTNQIVISRTTHPIRTPFPRWEWQDGQTIDNSDETYKSLLEAYRKEYVIQKKQQLPALKASTKKLAEIQQMINYYDDLEQAYDILNLEESWKSDEQELFEFIEGEKAKYFGLKLDIIGNGKLARITSDTAIGPILYIIKKARITIKYKYFFYKNENGEWIYIM